ncbi:hypothetical protein AHAS_Ahas16G0093200 [Arachis hypogaea]
MSKQEFLKSNYQIWKLKETTGVCLNFALFFFPWKLVETRRDWKKEVVSQGGIGPNKRKIQGMCGGLCIVGAIVEKMLVLVIQLGDNNEGCSRRTNLFGVKVVGHRWSEKLVAGGRDALKVSHCLPAIAFPEALADKTSNWSVGWWSLLSFCLSNQFSFSSTIAVSSHPGNWQVEVVRMLEACWIVDEVVIMASSSKFCKDACMWNEPLADYWMEGNAGVSNPQDTIFDTRVEEDAELSDWEGRGASMLPGFLGLDGLRAEDVLEMKFSSPQEAGGFYNNYSRLKGFASRRGKTVRNTAGEIVRYTFVCNRQGFREKKWLEKVDRKREHKVVTRCGCMAEMRIKRKDGSGRWYVSHFVEEHNHELAYGKLVDYLRSHRKISEVEVAQLTSMREIGISIPKIYESFAAQLGGFNLVTFTKQDMYNEIRKQKGLQGGDVSAAIRYLEGLARMDGKMFWRYKLGAGQHLCNLFWSDGRCQEDYGIFGDVLAFDATYGRNKYNLPIVVFSGVNHHNQTCVFGTTMVSCES